MNQNSDKQNLKTKALKMVQIQTRQAVLNQFKKTEPSILIERLVNAEYLYLTYEYERHGPARRAFLAQILI